jgi:hypothetical protein
MPLVNASTATDLRNLVLLAGGNPATSGAGTIGLTSDPAGAQAAQWAVTTTQTGALATPRFFGRVTVNQNSQSGTNTSHYLAAGVYETNLAVDMGLYGQNQNVRASLRPFQGYDDNRMFFYLDGPIANRNRDAEVEHAGDHQYAYQNSLVALDTALGLVAAQGNIGPFPTALQATNDVNARITAALPVALQGIALTGAAFVQEYLRLCGQTILRDNNGWHTFGLTLLGAAPPGNISWLTGQNRDGGGVTRRFVQLTNGASAIGVHASATIIV